MTNECIECLYHFKEDLNEKNYSMTYANGYDTRKTLSILELHELQESFITEANKILKERGIPYIAVYSFGEDFTNGVYLKEIK